MKYATRRSRNSRLAPTLPSVCNEVIISLRLINGNFVILGGLYRARETLELDSDLNNPIRLLRNAISASIPNSWPVRSPEFVLHFIPGRFKVVLVCEMCAYDLPTGKDCSEFNFVSGDNAQRGTVTPNLLFLAFHLPSVSLSPRNAAFNLLAERKK